MPAKHPGKPRKNHLELTIQFTRGVRIAPLTQTKVRQLIQASLESDLALNLRFVGQHEARALNLRFRRRRYTPSVLTFSYAPEPLADIVVCTPVVRRQATEQGKSFSQHLSHMIVHASLHAQGYTHDKPAQAAAMEQRERCILARFGVPDPYSIPS